MPISHEDDNYFSTPGLSPFFAQEPLRHHRSICRVLRNLGRDRPSASQVQYAIEFFSGDEVEIVFTHTFMQKFSAVLNFEWDGHAVTRLSKYYPDVDLAELEPLLWEEFTGEFLIMYHRKDKCFWAYRFNGIDPAFQLVRLGYKWTDIAWEYPSLHFSRSERETRKRREAAEDSNKRRKVGDNRAISGHKS